MFIAAHTCGSSSVLEAPGQPILLRQIHSLGLSEKGQKDKNGQSDFQYNKAEDQIKNIQTPRVGKEHIKNNPESQHNHLTSPNFVRAGPWKDPASQEQKSRNS